MPWRRVRAARLSPLSVFPFLANVLVIAQMAAQQTQPSPRPMTVEDLFTIQSLGEVEVSRDGSMIAAVVQRPASDKEIYGRDLGGLERADIWLLPRDGGRPRNLTHGLRDGSGYWQPRWSPDGRRLAMVSTRGGDNIRLYVWDSKTAALKRVTERGVDLGNWSAGTIDSPGARAGAVAWLDARTVIVLELPQCEADISFDQNTINPRIAAREWAKLPRGGVPTASVVETGPGTPSSRRSMRELRAIDVVSGTSRLLAAVPYYRSTALGLHGTHLVSVSPDRRHAAVLVGVGPLAPALEHRVWGKLDTRLGIVRLEGSGEVRWVDDGGGLYARLSGWSPDGKQFAVLRQANKWTDEEANELFSVTVSSGETHRLLPPGWRASSAMPPGWMPEPRWGDSWQIGAVVWTAEGLPVIHADSGPRSGWWRLDPAGPLVNVTAETKGVPRTLEWTGDSSDHLAVTAGDLWRVDVSAGTAINLTAGFIPAVTKIVQPEVPAIRGRPLTGIVVMTADSGRAGYALIPITGGRAPRLLPMPSANATLDFFRRDLELALFREVLPTGTFLWHGDGRSAKFARLLALNEQLAGIADVKRRLITYRGIEGDTLQALLLLPANHDAATRYPLIAWVYAGDIVGDTLPWPTAKNDAYPYNLVPLVSRGYAVLIPSMPLPSGPGNPHGDPYIDLPKGVMPALDRAVDLGIADPGRLGVMGASFGGYSTYSLVTYTTRFRAAVAMQGISDLISMYGSFGERYTENPHERLSMAGLAEQGLVRMGAAPWQDLWRYLRNTPLFFADRVQTPLMAIHGDQDVVVMAQSEEFFTALQRQGKRAKLIRYWGEAHGIEAPPNVKHMWAAVFSWFDTYLAPAESTTSAAAASP
jgi:dipeptidyl aminopeptidase/acylaminoacyl peptidase